MTNTQSNKQIQNVKVIVNNNTAPPKRKARRKPPPPPPDVQLPTPKMETWRMQSPYPAQPIQYPLPITQIFPEKSVPPAYFEGHLTNMQNTLKDLREGFNQHVEELRNELLSRAATQQHAAHIERLVKDVGVQHENNLAGVEAMSVDGAQQSPQQAPPYAPPQPNAQPQAMFSQAYPQAPPNINDVEMGSPSASHHSVFSNPLFDDGGWNYNIPYPMLPSSHGSLQSDTMESGVNGVLPMAVSSAGSAGLGGTGGGGGGGGSAGMGSGVIGSHQMSSVGSAGLGGSGGGGSAGMESRVSGSHQISSVGSGAGGSSGGGSGGNRSMASGVAGGGIGSGGTALSDSGGTGGVGSNGQASSGQQHGAASMVYGESEGRPVDRGNESRAGGGFDRALEQVEALWQDYPNLSRREQSRRLQRVRAIASTWGIDNNGQMRTLVRRILGRPL